jgi:hypothetical protein
VYTADPGPYAGVDGDTGHLNGCSFAVYTRLSGRIEGAKRGVRAKRTAAYLKRRSERPER